MRGGSVGHFGAKRARVLDVSWVPLLRFCRGTHDADCTYCAPDSDLFNIFLTVWSDLSPKMVSNPTKTSGRKIQYISMTVSTHGSAYIHKYVH